MTFSPHRSELLPWMTEDYEQLVTLHASNKLAHAYLFGGQQGLGKEFLAKHFAHFLLCADVKDMQPCGQCRNCELINAGTHPDLKLIQPESSNEIKIDQIRQTIDFVQQTSQRGGYKIVIIRPAEAMNINSANALLKILEEPSSSTLLILVSHQPALLPATIRSRCHNVKFSRPAADKVIPWLESKNIHASPKELLRMANNIPLRALHYADDDALHDRSILHSVLEKLLQGELDIAEAASACESYSLEENIEGMMLCTSDIIAHNQAELSNKEFSLHDHDLKSLAHFFQDATRLKSLHTFYRALLAAQKAVKSTSNPNPSLVMESLFYNWAAIVR
jgi:DNA polymerase-3 subunit delta'